MRRIVLPATPVRLSCAPLLSRLLVSRVCAGFALPAKDLDAQRIDLAPVLAAHPQPTFMERAQGHLRGLLGYKLAQPRSDLHGTCPRPLDSGSGHLTTTAWP